jgi:hypothetical protein
MDGTQNPRNLRGDPRCTLATPPLGRRTPPPPETASAATGAARRAAAVADGGDRRRRSASCETLCMATRCGGVRGPVGREGFEEGQSAPLGRPVGTQRLRPPKRVLLPHSHVPSPSAVAQSSATATDHVPCHATRALLARRRRCLADT